ncbi:hypothetical protein ACFX1X_027368 [Malus domestica]
MYSSTLTNNGQLMKHRKDHNFDTTLFNHSITLGTLSADNFWHLCCLLITLGTYAVLSSDNFWHLCCLLITLGTYAVLSSDNFRHLCCPPCIFSF